MSITPLHEAMDSNLAAHLAHLPAHLPTGSVQDSRDLLLVDSGLPSDTFNAVCRARLDEADADSRIEEAVRNFGEQRRPFSWWVGPTSTPADLEDRLQRHGLAFAEEEPAMALDLPTGSMRPILSPGFEIRRAESPAALLDFAAVMAANWDPPDPVVLEVFTAAAAATLAPSSPARYLVGYLDGRPAAAAECFLAHGVAGIYSVVTLAGLRGRGFGTRLVAAALHAAGAEGYTKVVLQASGAGEPVYARLGFRTVGVFREYKPQAEMRLP